MRIRSTKARRRSGFTMIEVMMSLFVLTFVAMAMVQLQQHNTRALAHSRNLSVGVAIAERWAARLKQDAHTWTQVGSPAGPTETQVLQNTRWLRQVGAPLTTPNSFQTINVDGLPVSNAFDFYGNDLLNPRALPATSPEIVYCAAFRPRWVYPGRTMRIEIRVWWRRDARQGTATTIAADFASCSDNHETLDPVSLTQPGPREADYHVIYLPVVVSVVSG